MIAYYFYWLGSLFFLIGTSIVILKGWSWL